MRFSLAWITGKVVSYVWRSNYGRRGQVYWRKVTLQLIVLGAVIGINNLATALTLGALGQQERRWRVLLVFAVFEFSVPLIGLWLGQLASESIAAKAEWLGPLLLACLGFWTLFEATRRTREQASLARWLTTWQGLLVLSALLSLDNLVVGFSLGLGGIAPLLMAVTIMTFSVIFSWVGIEIGARSRRNYETLAELVSGLFLLGVAWADWIGVI